MQPLRKLDWAVFFMAAVLDMQVGGVILWYPMMPSGQFTSLNLSQPESDPCLNSLAITNGRDSGGKYYSAILESQTPDGQFYVQDSDVFYSPTVRLRRLYCNSTALLRTNCNSVYSLKMSVTNGDTNETITDEWTITVSCLPKNMTQRSVHWFRKGLRLHDNPALNAACENASHVWPVFVLDPWFARFAKVGVNRWRFLLQSLVDLDNQLKVHNSRLYVVKGSPKEVFPRIFKKWGITRLTFEVDTEPYARQRDMDVEKIAREFHVEVVKCVSHTLYDTERIIAKNGGSPPLTYQRFQTVLSQLGPPPKAVSLNKEQLAKCRSPDGTDDEEGYDVPSLEDLGKREEDCGPCLYPGGETEALRKIDDNFEETRRVNLMHSSSTSAVKKYFCPLTFDSKESGYYTARVCAFEKPETDPNSLEPSTSVLSPYLKFGCLSPRLFYNRLAEIYKCKNHSQSPVSHGELLWREFFYTVAAGTPNFNKMVGNPVCIQVDWDTNDELLTAWKTGRTGYPFIDAIMTQLKDEGWIHHLDRHAVAWFLTRGDLWISWEEGQKVFEEYLLDADYSLNAANWLLASGSALFQQNSSVYNPVDFGKSTDKQGDFIRKYVPILKEFPEKYIYEPWTAPIDVQEKFGCIIGEDYPKPIVDHEAARKKNIERMAAAYARRNGSKDAEENAV